MSAVAYAVPARRVPARRVPAPKLRITARGRAVLAAIVAAPLVVAALVVGLNGGGAVATVEQAQVTFSYVSLAPGETLWELADRVAPGVDPREFIADVETLNNISATDLQAGQQLAVPAEYLP
jgi:hypothetical protein